DRLDWTTAFADGALLDPGSYLPTPVELPIDFTSDMDYRVVGSVTGTGKDRDGNPGTVFLNAGDVSFAGSADFMLTRSTMDVDTDGAGGNTVLASATVDQMALTLTDVGVKVDGVASLTLSGSLALVRVKAAGEADDRYTALKLSEVTVGASTADSELDFGVIEKLIVGGLEYNDAAATFDRLDWNTAFDLDADGIADVLDPGAKLPTPVDLTIDFDTSLTFRVLGEIAVNIEGYVLAAGHFDLAKTTPTGVDLGVTNGNAMDVDLTRIDLTGVNLFVGAGGAFDTTIPEAFGVDTSNATGFQVEGAELTVVMARVTDSSGKDTRRWTGITAAASGISIVGLDDLGFTLEVTKLEILSNKASGTTPLEAEPIDWSKIYTDKNDRLNGLKGEITSVGGEMAMNLDGYVLAAGGFSVSSRAVGNADLGAINGRSVDVELLQIDLTEVDLFVGAGGAFNTTTTGAFRVDTSKATGFFVENVDLHLAIASVEDPTPTDPLTDTRRWGGIVADADGLSVVGLDDITLEVDNLVVHFNTATGNDGGNPAADAVRIDWLSVIGASDPLAELNDTTTVSVTGDVKMKLGGYVLAAGKLGLTKTTPTGVNLGTSGASVNVDLLSFALTDLDLFVGTGAVFVPGVGGPATIDITAATGFSVTRANLSLAIASVTDATPEDPQTDTRRWTGIGVSVGGLGVVGLPNDFTLEAGNLKVLFNTASGDDVTGDGATRIDWDKLIADTNNPLHGLTADKDLEVTGDITVDLGGYVLAAGSFGVTRSDSNVDLLGSGAVDVDLLRIDLSGVDLFVGAGGAFDTSKPGAFGVDTSNATGFSVKDANLSMAIARLSGAAANDTRQWIGVVADANGLSLVGLPDVSLAADNLEVMFNRATGTNDDKENKDFVNWSVLYPETADRLNGLEGEKTSVSGDVTLELAGYVLVAGGFNVTKTTENVDLLGAGAMDVDLVRIDLTGVDLFVGVGGAFDKTTADSYRVDAMDDSATGFLVTDTSFSMAIASLKDAGVADTRRWTGIAASAGNLKSVGLTEDLALGVSNLSVLFNTSSGNDGAATPVDAINIDWSTLVTDIEQPLNSLSAHVNLSVSGDVAFNLDGYVLAAGEFSVTSSTVNAVQPSGGAAVDVDLLRVDLTGVNLFVGVGGKFDTSKPGDFTVDISDATGFSAANANLSVAFARVKDAAATDTRRWTGIAASADGLSVVGLEDITLDVNDLEVMFNLVSGADNEIKNTNYFDWSTLYVDPTDRFFGLKGETTSVVGDLTINLGGYVMVAGSFSVERKILYNSDPEDNGENLDLDLLRINLRSVDLLVGFGGTFIPGESAPPSIDTTEATGFAVSDANLDLAIASVSEATDKRRWTGIAASAENLRVIGLPSDFTLDVSNLSVLFNQATGKDGRGKDAEKINWLRVTDASDPLNDLAADTTLAVSGNLTVNLGGYVLSAGSFDVTKTEETGADLGPENGTSVDVDLLRVDLTGVDLFVGTGAVFVPGVGGPATIDITAATGFLVTSANLSLAIASVIDTTPEDPQVDTRRWTGIAASAENLGVKGLSGLDLNNVSNVRVLFNQASGASDADTPVDATPIDWATLGSGSPLSELSGDTTLLVAADVSLNLLEVVTLDGSIAIKVSKQEVFLRDAAGNLLEDPVDASALEIGISKGTLTIKGDGQVAKLDGPTLGLAYYSAKDQPGKSWLALKTLGGKVMEGGTLGTVGVSDVSVSLNRGYGSNNDTTVDFKRSFETSLGKNNGLVLVDTNSPEGVPLDFDSKLLEFSAVAELAFADFFYFKGQLTFGTGINKDVYLAGDAINKVNVTVTTASVTNAAVFVGSNGPYRSADGSLSPDSVGFQLTGVDFVVVKFAEVDGAREWTAISATAITAGLVGFDDFTLAADNISVLLNEKASDETAINLKKSYEAGASPFPEGVDVADFKNEILEVRGNAVLDIDGFVQVSGGFAFTRSAGQQVFLDDETVSKEMTVTTFGFDKVNAFVGAGPYFVDSNGDGVIDDNDIPSDEAAGVLLKDVNLALAYFKPGNGSASYYAVSASAELIELPGLELSGGSSGFSGRGYRIEVNGSNAAANGKVVDFAKTYVSNDGTNGVLTVQTSPSSSVDFGYTSKLERVAIENLTVIIDEYVHLSGGFSFTRQENLTVTLSNAAKTRRVVNAYAFGAGNVDLFVGSGPYFEDTHTTPDSTDSGTVISGADGAIDEYDERNSQAVGLALENVNFGLIVMRPTADKSTKYIALNATANRVGLVGIDEFKLSASGINVEYNTVKGKDVTETAPVVDFKASFPATSGLDLDLGSNEVKLDYNGRVLRASVSGAELQIDEYVFVRGAFSFEKGDALNVTLSDGSLKDVSAINVGGDNITMFFGANGPYFIDGNDDGILNFNDQKIPLDGEVNDEAVGLHITNASFALSLLKPTVGSTRYLALTASADQFGFVGTDVFKLNASSIEVELNIATGGGANAQTPVVNFGAIKASERLALFDTDNSQTITVGELRTLAGQGGGAGYSSTIGELYSAGALATDEVDLDELVRILDVNADGIFAVSEAQIFLANNADAVAADADGDHKLDAAGYEINTGGVVAYLSESSRRIYASGDDALISIDEFAFLNGNFAFDLGSRETVTIDTGIPASIGALAGGAVEPIQEALANLRDQLDPENSDGLISKVKTAISDAIAKVKTSIDAQVDDIVESIADQLSSSLAAVVSDVKGSINTKLEKATAGLSVEVDSLIDAVIDPIIVDKVENTALQGLLRILLSPFKKLLGTVFQDALQEAMTGALDRITASISDAINAGINSAADSVKDEIHKVLDPQFARVKLKLNDLIGRIDAKLNPIISKLEGIANIQIGPNFSTISGIEVDVTAIGLSNARAFVGLPPAGGFDFSRPFLKQEGLGFFIDNLDLALGLFKPVVTNQLPSFTAAKITADSAGFHDGGAGILDLTARDIEVELNLGGPIVKGTSALFGNGTIDFKKSFEKTPDAKDGEFLVQTGTTTAPISLDFKGELIRANVAVATVHISEFVYITGSLAFEKGAVRTVDVTNDGLLNGLTSSPLLDQFGLTLPESVSIPATGATSTEVSTLTIGASNVHAFVGLNGPYWKTDDNGKVTVDPKKSEDAIGLVIEDFDFGLAIMKPTFLLDPVKYFALKATAESISLVGIKNVSVKADRMLVEVNLSSPSVYGAPLFPSVDFASTKEFSGEQLALFASDNTRITEAEFAALTSGVSPPRVIPVDATDHERLVALLDTNDDGMIQVEEAAAGLGGDEEEALKRATDADKDGDGKIDPLGFEVATGTGTEPVYLAMNSSLVRAQGFVELNLFNSIIVTGSVAFELGPNEDVTLSDGTTKVVKTMTFGAANVTAFIGAGGPYWTDVNKNHQVDSGELNEDSVGFHVTNLDLGLIVMAATQPEDGLGLYLAGKLSVYEFGLVGVSGLTATGAFDVELNLGFGFSGYEASFAVVDLTKSFSEATALFALMDTNSNGVISQAEQETSFGETFPENITSVSQLSSVLNSRGDVVDEYLMMTEVVGQLSESFKSANQAAIEALDVDKNGRLNTGYEVNTGNPAAPVVLDFEAFLLRFQLGGKLEQKDTFRMQGYFLFEIDTSGLKAFVMASLDVGPDIGSENAERIFTMNALGALVINSKGLAADLEISVGMGGALSSVLSLNASARLLINTTGEKQNINIPERYVGFLTGSKGVDTIEASEDFDVNLVNEDTNGNGRLDPGEDSNGNGRLDNLVGGLDDRFNLNEDGSATFSISGAAPRLGGGFDDKAGSYFLVTLNGSLSVARTFTISADFHLKVSDQGLELAFNGALDLNGFATVDVAGGAIIEDGVFAAYAELNVDFRVLASVNGGIRINGGANLQINTGSSDKEVSDASGNKYKIKGETYAFAIDASLDFGIVSASGKVDIALVQKVFSIKFEGEIDFFGISKIGIKGDFSTDGTFSFTGKLKLDLTVGSGASKFGIDGELRVTLTNKSFSGFGSVSLVVFGEEIKVASAELNVNWANGSWSVYAEGPLSVWLRVSGYSSGKFSIEGGLGFFDDVVEVLGDAVNAIAEGAKIAAEAVWGAIEDLGTALVAFGEDVAEFFSGAVGAIADAAEAVWDEVSSWFASERTIITKYSTPTAQPFYTYKTNLENGVLTIDNKSASHLSLFVVDGYLIVDAPDTTQSVPISSSQKQTRKWVNDGWPPWGEWSNWRNSGNAVVNYATIKIINASRFNLGSVSKIVIRGTDASETIAFQKSSVNIDADIYGYGGDDVISTGGGNDRVWGGNGKDVIYTNGGNDALYGESNNDKLFGGKGNDHLDGGAGDDFLDENDGRSNPGVTISETNTLIGGAGDDILLGSPGRDTITGGSGEDRLLGLSNDDQYIFKDDYGIDEIVDYNGQERLFFGDVSVAMQLSMSDSGTTVDAGAGNSVSADKFASFKEVSLGSNNDHFDISRLPNVRLNITDVSGNDVYDFDLDALDSAGSVARVDILDTVGGSDRIDLDVNSTGGYDIYQHPGEVLLNNLNVTFSTGVETLNLTDHAAETTITTQPGSRFESLLVKAGVTIRSASGGPIELLARDDFNLEDGATIATTGLVTIRGDYGDADSAGSTINLLGTINASQVEVFGNANNDTVNVSNVTIGSETTISVGAGSDLVNIQTINAETTVNTGPDSNTVNVGSTAPGSAGNINGIRSRLIINGESSNDTLNVYDREDGAETGSLTATDISGLNLGSTIRYNSATDKVETLNVFLGAREDTFTILSTDATTTTTLNSDGGNDIINLRSISGTTIVNSGNGADTINVGSNARGTSGNSTNNRNGTINGITRLLTVNGGGTGSERDRITVDDTADIESNDGVLTANRLTGLGMAVGIGYSSIENLIVSLGNGGNTFGINSTHGGATASVDEETIVNTGDGADIILIANTTDTLVVNSEADSDTITVNDTGLGSSTVLNGDNGSDVINIHGISAGTTVNGGDGADTVNVGSNSQGNPGAPNFNSGGTVSRIASLLTVNGDGPVSDSGDVLNIDDTGAGSVSTGALTSTRITGLRMSGSITYGTIDELNVSLGSGENNFTVSSTHGAAIGGFEKTTTLRSGGGNDTVTINDVTDSLTVYGEANSDTITV
ncbi:MAG: hypothetical protein P8Q54_11370, partial [Akkermansiaceae bacterium]|nr:hypothetical protein [Akkermansiaceae bacterium]